MDFNKAKCRESYKARDNNKDREKSLKRPEGETLTKTGKRL